MRTLGIILILIFSVPAFSQQANQGKKAKKECLNGLGGICEGKKPSWKDLPKGKVGTITCKGEKHTVVFNNNPQEGNPYGAHWSCMNYTTSAKGKEKKGRLSKSTKGKKCAYKAKIVRIFPSGKKVNQNTEACSDGSEAVVSRAVAKNGKSSGKVIEHGKGFQDVKSKTEKDGRKLGQNLTAEQLAEKHLGLKPYKAPVRRPVSQ